MVTVIRISHQVTKTSKNQLLLLTIFVVCVDLWENLFKQFNLKQKWKQYCGEWKKKISAFGVIKENTNFIEQAKQSFHSGKHYRFGLIQL